MKRLRHSQLKKAVGEFKKIKLQTLKELVVIVLSIYKFFFLKKKKISEDWIVTVRFLGSGNLIETQLFKKKKKFR